MSASLSATLSHRITTPFAISLGLGIAASSYFTFGNLGAHFFGPYRLIDDPSLSIARDTKIKVEIWAWFYEHASVHMASSAALATSAYIYSAYAIEPSAFNGPAHTVRPLLLAAGGLISVVIPWTLITMMPTNKQLLAIRDADRQAQKSGSTANAVDVDQLLIKWGKLHAIRMVLGGTSWFAGIVALYAAF